MTATREIAAVKAVNDDFALKISLEGSKAGRELSASFNITDFTTQTASIYDQVIRTRPTGFLRSFFQEKVIPTKTADIRVRKAYESVAVDTDRQSQGDFVKALVGTQKNVEPPYYQISFDQVDTQIYDMFWNTASWNANVGAQAANGIAMMMAEVQKMLERAEELQVAQVFHNGVITSFKDGSTINFGRKAGSMVDLGAGNYWSDSGTNPYLDIQAGGDFLRKYGLMQSGKMIAIMGYKVKEALLTNPLVSVRSDIKMWKIDDFNRPERVPAGGVFDGVIGAGPYTVQLMSYPAWYNDPTAVLSTNTKLPYVAPNEMILIPAELTETQFDLVYCQVPNIAHVLAGDTSALPMQKRLFEVIVDPNLQYIRYRVKSAPIAIPTSLDSIYTIKCLAS